MSDTVTLTIDGRAVTVPPGTLVIEAAKRMGIEVPSFCYYPGLSLQAACRMCLVEIEKIPKLQTACTVVAQNGMVVKTNTPVVTSARKAMLELLLTNHPLDCPVCDKGGECELQDMTFRYGAASSRFIEEKIHVPEQKWSEIVYFDAPRCILCFRCVRVCDEAMDVKALGVGQRGAHSVIIPNQEDHLECEECGMCIDICPVGALTSGPYRYKTRPWEMKYVGTICTHCGDGCKTTLSVRNNQIIRGDNRDTSGINGEFLCVKGRYAFDFTRHTERLSQPLLRRNGKLVPVTWEEALEEAARRLRQLIDTAGPTSVGVIGSNRTTNEENYALARFARAVIGTSHLDHHRTADYAGLLTALAGTAPKALARSGDLASAAAILLLGNDPTHQHPLLAWNIRQAVRLNRARLFMINAREVKLKHQAKHFVRVAQGSEDSVIDFLAGGDVSLDYELELELLALRTELQKEANVIIVFGAELAGSALARLVEFGAKLPGETRYIALGDYSNSRGAADFGLLPDYLPGYVPVSDAAGRAVFERLWQATIHSAPGKNIREILEAAHKGELKALYIVGANPVKTFARPAQGAFGGALVIVHELFLTETAQQADFVFPVACAYEKEGTVTNTCGEVQQLKRALEHPGTRTDFDILRLLSHLLGKPFGWRNPNQVFEEIRQHVRGYQLSVANLLAGEALPTTPSNGHGRLETPAGLVFSSDDSLFTSGTLGRYSHALNACIEKDLPR